MNIIFVRLMFVIWMEVFYISGYSSFSERVIYFLGEGLLQTGFTIFFFSSVMIAIPFVVWSYVNESR